MNLTLFEIDEAIRAKLEELYEQVDEDGCLVGDFSELEQLNAEREAKIEGIALFYKETLAEAEAIKAEADKLAKRAKISQNKADRMKEFLAMSLLRENQEKFSTPRVKVSFRKSEQVIIDDDRILSGDFFKVKAEPDKTAIKAALKEGLEVKGAHLEEKQNIQIK